MISKEHRKHSDLAKPGYGHFGRNEWSFLGTNCGIIKALAEKIIRRLTPAYKVAYVDASHAGEMQEEVLPGRLEAGAEIEYTQHAGYHELRFKSSPNPCYFRQLFSGNDIVLVNGNHFEAASQIICLDPAKESSLRKRIARVNAPQMIIRVQDVEVFDFVKETCPSWQALPNFSMDDIDGISSFFRSAMAGSAPRLKGLVLAGGKSVRMGVDKGKLEWFGKEHRYYLADTLAGYCEEVFISCRHEQRENIDPEYHTLEDTFTGLGPMGAILSAFRKDPDAAWLVAACDMPFLDAELFRYLSDNRNRRAMATCFGSPADGLPEPLVTIWEPKSYPVLLSFLAQGYSCPRKVLLNSDIQLLEAPNPRSLMNVNTVPEAETARELLRGRE